MGSLEGLRAAVVAWAGCWHLGYPCLEVLLFSRSRNAGKTLLAERIVSALSSTGLPVVAVKHVHHGSPDLLSRKDAERMFNAGALASVAYGAEYSLIITRALGSPRDPVRLFSELVEGCFAVVFEGFRGLRGPIPVLLVRDLSEVDEESCRRLRGLGGLVASFNARAV
jgi:molybdopterin-guanine dinucleotide biosynthesis protein MobB